MLLSDSSHDITSNRPTALPVLWTLINTNKSAIYACYTTFAQSAATAQVQLRAHIVTHIQPGLMQTSATCLYMDEKIKNCELCMCHWLLLWHDFIRVKILDDDVDFKTLLPQNINNTLDDDIGDDNPAVAEFVDERPQQVKELERFRQSKQWKVISRQPGVNKIWLFVVCWLQLTWRDVVTLQDVMAIRLSILSFTGFQK